MRTLRLVLAASVALGALLGVSASPAFATSVSSGKAYYTVNGIPYWNRSGLNNNQIMVGSVSVGRDDSGTIPAGWSGGQASTYLNGALCSSAKMYYYPAAANSWTGGTTTKNCGHGNYTSRGSTAAYNGNGYNYYYTATSPIIQY